MAVDKEKINLIIAPVLVSLICVVLAVNVGMAKSQLNAERAKLLTFDKKLDDLNEQLVAAKGKYNEKENIISDLQNSLQAARQETINAQTEIANLKTAVSELEGTLQASSGDVENLEKGAEEE